MMENPLSWTKAHHAISEALEEYDEAGYGLSLAATIYERLHEGGFLKDESRTPAYSTWDELKARYDDNRRTTIEED